MPKELNGLAKAKIAYGGKEYKELLKNLCQRWLLSFPHEVPEIKAKRL